MYTRSLVWKALRRRFESNDFKEKEIQPLAEDHALTFMATVQPQLSVLGASGTPFDEDVDILWKTRVKEISNIYVEALMLKGLLMTSPYRCASTWIQSGTPINMQDMEQPYESDRHGMVKFCTCPAVWMEETHATEQMHECMQGIYPSSKACRECGHSALKWRVMQTSKVTVCMAIVA